MRAPTMQGVIERRVLVNYAVDPDRAAALLPAPFRPAIVSGAAVAGICLIRLGELRPRGVARWAGVRTENAAHRIAVEWDGPSGVRAGVYIPRRDSASRLTVAVGGRLYPGEHHHARFDVGESASHLRVGFAAVDGSASAAVDIEVGSELTGSALFADVGEASRFFEQGSVGYSPEGRDGGLAGLQLQTSTWRMEPAVIHAARSSLFDNPAIFPLGTATLDCALIMRQIPATWRVLASAGMRAGVPAP